MTGIKRWALLALCIAALPPVQAGTEVAALRRLLDEQRYSELRPRVEALLRRPARDSATRALIHDWLWLREDVVELERRIDAQPRSEAVEQFASGRLALERKQFERARQLFERARDGATDAAMRSRALQGLAAVAYQQRDYAGSLALLEQARTLVRPGPDLLMAINESLIRLGRVNDAVLAAKQAFALNPNHEHANYQLGNGYTRTSYRELALRCGERFQHAAGHTRKASDAFDRQALPAARRSAHAALAACPGYGRAHAVLAKVAETERLRLSIHRQADERAFAAAPMPDVPQIERYVLNWSELSPRHRKRVAMSVAPWTSYVPVLVAGGASHFIKPLWMRLSQTPGGAALRDARVGYDARLWDDVRGMGGHATVTGIEDVERSIFQRYNTVLHELSHQVHGILTEAQRREIDALYREAKSRDADGALKDQAFLSRYAGGSVWEYFAEGANGQDTPRRGPNDFREIVRERLLEKDPALQALVLRLFAQRDLSASLPLALVNGGFKEIAAGRLAQAGERLTAAGRLAPDDALVLRARLQLLALQGDAAAVQALAAQALAKHADHAPLRIAVLEARWHSGSPLAPQLPALLAGRERLGAQDQLELDMAAGRYAVHLGSIEQALGAYEAALSRQADNPEALWGRASALALAGRSDEAFADYARALKLRSGLQALRLEYSRELLLAGRVDAARAQLEEARTLNPGEPELLALQAWLALIDGDADRAQALAQSSLDAAPWCDSAALMKAVALRRLGRAGDGNALLHELDARLHDAATPRYVYRPEVSRWESVNLASAAWRRMRAALLSP